MGPESARSVTAVGMTLFLLTSVDERSSGNGVALRASGRPRRKAAGYVGAVIIVGLDGMSKLMPWHLCRGV
jgi:hypothetical protein